MEIRCADYIPSTVITSGRQSCNKLLCYTLQGLLLEARSIRDLLKLCEDLVCSMVAT